MFWLLGTLAIASLLGVSEHFREEEEKGLVVKLSSKTIEAAVLDDTKDLVILFHAQVRHTQITILGYLFHFYRLC
jgi:putative exporter of polyketide antibiotics